MKINNVEVNDYELFIISRWMYSMGVSVIDDSMYNELRTNIKSVMPDNEYITRSWSSDPCPVELLKKINRTDMIKSVTLSDKTDSIESINNWQDLSLTLGHIGRGGVLSSKIDGWNTQANYYNGELIDIQSRGRSADSIDMNILKPLIPNTVPVMGRVKVGLETALLLSKFDECKSLYGNATKRNAVRSVIANKDRLDLLTMKAHSLYGTTVNHRDTLKTLREWGFNVPEFHYVDSYDELVLAMKQLDTARSLEDAESDGLVYCGSVVYAIRLLSWEEKVFESFVVGYAEQFSEHRLNPHLLIYPIDRDGTKQSQVNITNWQRIIDNGLSPNAPISFRLVSASIADIDEDATRRLQAIWAGRYLDYTEYVKASEEKKKQAIY